MCMCQHMHMCECLYTYTRESVCHYFLTPVVFVVDDMLPQVSLAVQIDELNVKCNKETVLLLRKLAVENKVCMEGFSKGF